MTGSLDVSVRTELPLLIAFADLTRYSARARKTPDGELAEIIDQYYVRITERVVASGGRVIKFMGDAALIVFSEADVDRGVLALLALKDDVEGWLDTLGWDSSLTLRAHFGTCIAGPFGRGDARFDVIGSSVNTAALLPSRSFALSAQVFRKLSAETRRRFKKHTPAITYIRVEDRHG